MSETITNISLIHTESERARGTNVRTVQAQIRFDPNNPARGPRITDREGNSLFIWSRETQQYSPIGSASEAFPLTPQGLVQQNYQNILTLNQEDLKNNTTAVLNRQPNEIRSRFIELETFQPLNTFVDRQQNSSSGEGSSGALTLTEQERNRTISTKGVRESYDNMKYPLDLNQNVAEDLKQDVINFTMLSYGSRSFSVPRFGERKLEVLPGSVTMALQPSITDSNTVNWSDSTMDLISMGLAGASLGFIENGWAGTEETIESIRDSLGAEGNNVSAALKIWFAQQASQTQNLLSRLDGAILNPNLELLFENPDLRVFNYNFRLSPREPDEAKQIKKIIRFFKQGMAVQRSQAELFLKSPNVFRIKYLLSGRSGKDHPYLNKIKECALLNCSVDYTPEGSYMSFSGKENSMVSYNLSLSFKELEPVYADDYDGQDIEVGY
jgi:hypothetical protein